MIAALIRFIKRIGYNIWWFALNKCPIHKFFFGEPKEEQKEYNPPE